jgi:hypothetical protein
MVKKLAIKSFGSGYLTKNSKILSLFSLILVLKNKISSIF